MAYKNENIKHRQSISNKPKYLCPNCNNCLSLTKKTFMVICSKCKGLINKDEIIDNGV